MRRAEIWNRWEADARRCERLRRRLRPLMRSETAFRRRCAEGRLREAAQGRPRRGYLAFLPRRGRCAAFARIVKDRVRLAALPLAGRSAFESPRSRLAVAAPWKPAQRSRAGRTMRRRSAALASPGRVAA